MKLRLPILFFVISLWLCSRLAFAGVEQISEKEFRQLAEELAPKVNLFAAGWEKDPKAEFYGGTTRDYLYWLKGQFLEAKNRGEADAVMKKLRALPLIDVRSFIIGDSDVDVISTGDHTLDAAEFGVRKIDFQKPDILDPATELGQNEILQGYIPAEKVRLGKGGFQSSTLGNGVTEIYTGKLSVKFASPEEFAKSKYAKDGVNHPILLALRYIRVQAINYFRTHGKVYPETKLLHEGLDPESARQVNELVRRVVNSGELKPFLEKNQFKSWINGAIQKSFRSYTNPTAALELMKEFGVVDLPNAYPEQIEPVNQYVFSQFREPEKTAAALRTHQVNESKFFTPVKDFYPDGKLYHGTRSEEAFRGILFQGILPSDDGVAQGGLYGVAAPDKSFSENWGGDKNRLLSFEVVPSAKIVDVTEGEGNRIWEATKNIHQGSYDEFAKLFGIDIIRYPYSPQAFVVKNASVLSAPQGVYRKMMPVSELIELARHISDPEELLNMLSVNALSSREMAILLDASKIKIEDFAPVIKELGPSVDTLMRLPKVLENATLQREVEKLIANNYTLQEAVVNSSVTSPEFYDWVDHLYTRPDVRKHQHLGYSLFTTLKRAPGPTPNAVNFAISSIAGAPQDGRSIDFLSEKELNQDDLDRLAEKLSKKFKRFDSDLKVAELLLKKGWNREKAKNYLLEQAKFSKTPARKAHALTIALGQLPQDDLVLEKMQAFTEKYFSKLHVYGGDPNQVTIGTFLKYALAAPNNEALKKFLLNRRTVGSSDEALLAVQVLVRMNLQPADMVQILRGNIHRELVNYLLEYYTHERGSYLRATDPALTRAFLDTSLDYLEPSFHNFHLHGALKLSGDPKTMEKFFLEKFKRSGPALPNDQAQKVLNIIGSTYEEKPISPAVTEAFLGFLEKYPKRRISDHPLLALPLEDEAVAMRVQKYLLTAKHHISGASLKLLERMPGLTEEFKEYLASIPRSNFLHKELKEFETLKATKLGCAPSFAKIAN